MFTSAAAPGSATTPARRIALLAALATVGTILGCARMSETQRLRVEPLARPQVKVVVIGEGWQVRARRLGQEVTAQVAAVKYCRRVTTQRAKGWMRTETRPVGHSLLMEWVMGGLFTAGGGWILGYNALVPPKATTGETAIYGQGQAWAYGGGVTAIGLALLGAAAWQQWQVGVQERELGERILRRQGQVRPCRATKATSGRVRLTLGDGTQLEADIDERGHAHLSLPPDIEARIAGSGRRATVEVIGDWRSQARIRL